MMSLESYPQGVNQTHQRRETMFKEEKIMTLKLLAILIAVSALIASIKRNDSWFDSAHHDRSR